MAGGMPWYSKINIEPVEKNKSVITNAKKSIGPMDFLITFLDSNGISLQVLFSPQ